MSRDLRIQPEIDADSPALSSLLAETGIVLMGCEHVDLLRACTAASYRTSSPSTSRPLVSSMRTHGGHRVANGGRCARVQVGRSRAAPELADMRGRRTAQ